MSGRDVPAGRAADVEPVPAASIVVIREGFEVLLLRRNEASGFVPGSWIFPGGALEPRDRDLAEESLSGDAVDMASMKICGIRETLEESGVWLGAPEADAEAIRERIERGGTLTASEVGGSLSRLVPLARWVTPEGFARRYDTWFFAAQAPDGCCVRVDGSEGVEARWLHPASALEENRAGRLPMVFPTIRNLKALVALGSFAAILERGVPDPLPLFRPMLIEKDGKSRIVLPEES